MSFKSNGSDSYSKMPSPRTLLALEGSAAEEVKDREYDRRDEPAPATGGDAPASPGRSPASTDGLTRCEGFSIEASSPSSTPNFTSGRGQFSPRGLSMMNPMSFMSGDTTIIRNVKKNKAVRGPLFKFAASITTLAIVIVVMGAAIRSNEGPIEEENYQAVKERLDLAERVLMNRAFGYFVPLPDLNALPVNGCPGATSCRECLQMRGNNSEPTVDRHRSTFANDPARTSVCGLVLPSVQQVVNCRSQNQTQLAINPFYYDPDCLVDSPLCPNCDRLASVIDALSFPGLGANPVQYVQLAEIYLVYKDMLEDGEPEKYFTWPGSLYFSTTIVSSIGYGDFVVTTDGSKWIIAMLAIPCVALFGYALKNLASIILNAINGLASRALKGEYDFPPLRVVRGQLIRFIKETSKDEFTCPQVLKLFDELGTMPRRPEARALAVENITKIFVIMDPDGDLHIPKGFILTVLLEYYESYQAHIQRYKATRDIMVGLIASVLWLLTGTVGFWLLYEGDGWSALDAYYFSVVTLTTVGFGDFAPAPDSASILFWYFYIVIGLGLIGALIQSASNFYEAIRASSTVDDGGDHTFVEAAGLQTL